VRVDGTPKHREQTALRSGLMKLLTKEIPEQIPFASEHANG
jgi:hypothetical protein